HALYRFACNPSATTEIYPLSLHDALPIWLRIMTYNIHKGIGGVDRKYSPERVRDTIALFAPDFLLLQEVDEGAKRIPNPFRTVLDRKSTRLNSSHSQISYAVFCLKKKNNI